MIITTSMTVKTIPMTITADITKRQKDNNKDEIS